MIRIAINGFGRIGRNTLKALLSKKGKFKIVAINDLAPPESLAYLLKRDSVYGTYADDVSVARSSKKVGSVKPAGVLKVGKRSFAVFNQKDPRRLPWKSLKVDVVLECTGVFRTFDLASAHLKAGAKRVIISAPGKGGAVEPYILGINGHQYDSSHTIIDNASCTTNCISPVVAIMNDTFGVAKSMMTTIHAYTADQALQDGPHRDPRRGRAAAMNIIPTTTGSAISTTKLIPELESKFDGIAVRVPVVTGSLSDFTFVLNQKVTVKQVNDAFKNAVKSLRYKKILDVSEDPLVSTDIIGSEKSAIIDLGFTRVVDGDLVKVLAWYDNEWGYSHRLAEMALLVGKAI